jgi:hypothetical protein
VRQNEEAAYIMASIKRSRVNGSVRIRIPRAAATAFPIAPVVGLDLTRFYETSIPRNYLNCTEDTALPQGSDWGWHPRMSSRLGLFRLVHMPGSHEAIFTNPAALAEKIIEAGRD